MKIIITMMIVFVFSLNTIFAQEQTESKEAKSNSKVTGKIEISIGNDKEEIKVKEESKDTTIIRFGKKEMIIVEKGGNKQVDVKNSKDWDDKDDDDQKFDGHWAGFDLGVNGFTNENYNSSGGVQFMEVNQVKSLETNFNFLEYNIGFQKQKNNIGLVTGMGLSYHNYKFENPYSIQKVDGMIVPLALNPDGYVKSKLTVVYLTVPLLMEFQIPVNDRSNKLFVSGGIVGGLNIGSHTKVKWDDKKEKERGGFNINPFKYEAMLRVGLKDISLYASYNLNPLFKDNAGPDLTPFSIGISLVNF